MTEDHNPYAVLGVSPIATPAEISRAFRAKLRALHPDTRHRDAAGAVGDTQLQRLIAAYHLLRDPSNRGQHDRNPAAAPAPRGQQRSTPSAPQRSSTNPEGPLTIPVTYRRGQSRAGGHELWAGPVRRHRGPIDG